MALKVIFFQRLISTSIPHAHGDVLFAYFYYCAFSHIGMPLGHLAKLMPYTYIYIYIQTTLQ